MKLVTYLFLYLPRPSIIYELLFCRLKCEKLYYRKGVVCRIYMFGWYYLIKIKMNGIESFFIEIDFFFNGMGVLNDIKCAHHLYPTLNLILNYLNNEF